MKKYTKGFTLIELLVVIAIIGILSSVVLVSLNTAREKGKDAKIQSTAAGIRSAAEIYYSNNSTYGSATTTTCATGMFGDALITPYVTSLSQTVAGFTNPAIAAGTTNNVHCYAGPSGYMVAAKLSTGKYACYDSTGQASTSATMGTISTSNGSLCN
jgi:prepilin-type N-terminal cleavage/methylation domain-containing protein